VPRELQGAARAHPDEEHRLRRAVVALVGIDVDVVVADCSPRPSRATSAARLEPAALRLGYDYAIENFDCPLSFHSRRWTPTATPS
jgi:hypothetical protein